MLSGPGAQAGLMAVASLLLAGCGILGAVAPPPPGDLSGLQRPSSPNTALVAPAGFTPVPDLPTRRYPVPADRLLRAVRGVILALPRSSALAEDPARRRADHVVRSLVFRFPDIVQVQVLPADDGTSDLVLYSYSLMGHSDLGVNLRRVMAILAALDAELSRGG